MMAHLLAGADGALSFSEPFLHYAVAPHWMLNRFYYNFQKSAELRRLRPPCTGNTGRFGAFLRKMARLNGFPVLLIKETYHNGNANPRWRNDALLTRLATSGSPVVALIRNPYDAVASLVELGRWLVGIRGYLIRFRWPVLEHYRSRTEIVRWAANNWSTYCDWAGRHGFPLLRYEDLVRRPEPHLRDVCRRCGLRFHRRMLNHRDRRPAFAAGLGDPGMLRLGARRISTKSIGRGRALTAQQRQIVRDACATLAAHLGYAL